MIGELSKTIAPTTYEEPVAKLMEQEFREKGLTVKRDKHGNILAYRSLEKHPIVLSAHMDEIGIMVKSIDEDGFIRFVRLGGYDPRYLLGKSVVIYGEEPVKGIVQMNESDEPKDKIKTKDLFIDTGLTKKELPLMPGDPGGVVGTFHETSKYIQGKSLDDRIGCYVLLELASVVPENVVLMGSVQEEVSHEGKGAMLASWDLEPSLFIAVDVGGANDVPGGEKTLSLDKGPASTVSEISAIRNVANRNLVKQFISIAKENNIPYQLEITESSATEASNLFNLKSGVPSIAVSTPIRYIHTFNEMASKKDIKHTIEWLSRFLEEH